MQEPRTWDLSLFDELEDPRVREQLQKWIDLLQQHYETRTPFSISFQVPDGELTPEGAACPVFDRLLMTYGNVGRETRLQPSWESGTFFWLADFVFLPEAE